LQQIVVVERPAGLRSEERKTRLPFNCAFKR
jgi:hypothetical protein